LKEKGKTKEQLIDELERLRKQIAELEISEARYKRAKEVLLESEDQFRVFVETASDLMHVTNKDGYITYVNDATAKTLGYSKEEMIGIHITELIRKEDVTNEFDLKLKELITKGKISLEPVWVTKDGREIYGEIRVVAIYDSDGKYAGARAVFRDFTDRKMIEEKLRESELKFKTIFNNVTDGLLLVNVKDKKFYMGNNMICQMLGYDQEEIKNLRIPDIHPKEDLPYVYDQFEKQLKREIMIARDIPVKRKDGSVFYADISSVTIVLSGKFYLISIFRDIAERKQKEEDRKRFQAQLIHSKKMAGIGNLASGIAHEFNNLLQIISGHVQFAQKTGKPEDMKEALDIVINTSDKATKIVRDLLAFSRMESADKELCYIKEPLESVLSLTEAQLKKNNIKIERNYGRSSKLSINKGEMQQVFLNMITNARDAILPKRGKLKIRIRQIQRNVEVSFCDTGRGIKEEELEKVFEPFYTTKVSRGRRVNNIGTGLGLSVSYGIVKRHGGTIRVEGNEGNGAIFTVVLPIKKSNRTGISP